MERMGNKRGVTMVGYCGKCQTHYECYYTQHELECGGESRGVEQGSEEDFENRCRLNDWDDETAREIWDKYYR